MSIVLPSVLNLGQQKAEKYIQDGHLRSLHEQMGIFIVKSMYLRSPFADSNAVPFADTMHLG